MRSDYSYVQVAKGDKGKITCIIRYYSFEFLVMSFKLINVFATFYNIMNDVLYDFLDSFMVVYLDDIVIYSECFEDHVTHLRRVFPKIRKYKLYVKKNKCEFCRNRVMFLRYWVSKGRIGMDERKIQAILDCPTPSKVKDLRSFLRLANYYRRFIEGYKKKVSPFTNLLKKVRKWD